MKVITNKNLVKNFKRIGYDDPKLDETKYHLFISCNEIYKNYISYTDVTRIGTRTRVGTRTRIGNYRLVQ